MALDRKVIEEQIIELVATDRIYIPLSSMDAKLKRARLSLAKNIDFGNKKKFVGERVYAMIQSEDKKKAKGMKEGIDKFCEDFPKYGKILREYIQEERTLSEVHLYFGLNPGCKLASNDYLGVITNFLGFTNKIASDLYPELMEISRKISKKREEERSILIGAPED